MMKPLFLGLLLLSLTFPGAMAQTISGGGAASRPAAGHSHRGEKNKAAASQAPQGPTLIDSESMDYDEKTRIAIFTGDNYGVFVKDPSFTINCDKLTAYMRKGSGAGPKVPGAPKVAATPTPAPAAHGKGASTEAASAKSNGLQRAIAEGPPERPVVIVQDKPGVNGAAPEHDVGIAAKADYNADTGDVFLTGWPRVSQGTDTQIATSPRTIMIMNRDGRTMKTIGPSRTVIEQAEQPKTSGTSSASSADASSSPNAQ
jgi:lipopolysaccharide export system protein LptA